MTSKKKAAKETEDRVLSVVRRSGRVVVVVGKVKITIEESEHGKAAPGATIHT